MKFPVELKVEDGMWQGKGVGVDATGSGITVEACIRRVQRSAAAWPADPRR